MQMKKKIISIKAESDKQFKLWNMVQKDSI